MSLTDEVRFEHRPEGEAADPEPMSAGRAHVRWNTRESSHSGHVSGVAEEQQGGHCGWNSITELESKWTKVSKIWGQMLSPLTGPWLLL